MWEGSALLVLALAMGASVLWPSGANLTIGSPESPLELWLEELPEAWYIALAALVFMMLVLFLILALSFPAREWRGWGRPSRFS